MFPRKTAAMEIPPAYACFSRPIRSAAIGRSGCGIRLPQALCFRAPAKNSPKTRRNGRQSHPQTAKCSQSCKKAVHGPDPYPAAKPQGI